MEGGDVLGVSHNTNVEYGTVASTCGFGPEGQLQGVDGSDHSVDRRKDNSFIVAVGAGGSGEIPVETTTTRVSGRGVYVRVSVIGRTIIDMVPAGYNGTCRTGASREVFEAIKIRYGNEGAWGSVVHGGGYVGVAAVSRDAKLIMGVGSEVGREDGVAGDCSASCKVGPRAGTLHTVVYIPAGLLITREPSELIVAHGVHLNIYSRGSAGSQSETLAATASQEACITAPVGLTSTGCIHLGGAIGSATIDTVGECTARCRLITENER